MTIPVLLIGALIAMCVFTALGWSVARAFQVQGRARVVHLVHAGLILLGMALISLGWPLSARFIGLALTGVALWAASFEARWSRLLPVFGAAFGVALLLGLPFDGR